MQIALLVGGLYIATRGKSVHPAKNNTKGPYNVPPVAPNLRLAELGSTIRYPGLDATEQITNLSKYNDRDKKRNKVFTLGNLAPVNQRYVNSNVTDRPDSFIWKDRYVKTQRYHTWLNAQSNQPFILSDDHSTCTPDPRSMRIPICKSHTHAQDVTRTNTHKGQVIHDYKSIGKDLQRRENRAVAMKNIALFGSEVIEPRDIVQRKPVRHLKHRRNNNHQQKARIARRWVAQGKANRQNDRFSY